MGDAASSQAEDALLDAEHLAAELLAEAARQAEDLVAAARQSGVGMTDEMRASIEAMFQARQDELLSALDETRSELRAALASARPAAAPVAVAAPTLPPPAPAPAVSTPVAAAPSFVRSVSVRATLPWRPRRSESPDDPTPPVPAGVARFADPGSDEAFRVAVFRAVAGIEPMPEAWRNTQDIAVIASATERGDAIRASARRAADRAAAERLAVQTEAVQRQAARRSRSNDPATAHPAIRAVVVGRTDQVVALSARRSSEDSAGAVRRVPR